MKGNRYVSVEWIRLHSLLSMYSLDMQRIINTPQHASEQLKALELEHSEAEKVHVQAVSDLKHAREELSKLQKRRQALISSIDDSATSHADKVLIAFLGLGLFFSCSVPLVTLFERVDFHDAIGEAPGGSEC